MKITINIKTDNEAFQDNKEGEVWRIVTAVANRLEGGQSMGTCFDSNGNLVGEWKATGK